jgi:hypothetical protein
MDVSRHASSVGSLPSTGAATGPPADHEGAVPGAGEHRSAGVRRPTVLAAALLTLGFVVLSFAWAGANPKGASPDAPHHVVKAYVTGRGDIWGEPALPEHEGEASTQRWFNSVSRAYFVPARIAPPESISCYGHDRSLTADCQRLDLPPDGQPDVLVQNHFGTYNPALYAPLSLSMLGASDYATAEWRGRLAVVAICTVFVGWAALLLARPGAGWTSLAGLVLALTPLVVFTSSNVTTSGIEITSAICFWVALLTIVRAPRERWGAPWVAAGVSGATMAISRPVDAALVLVVIATVAIVAGRQARDVIGTVRRPAVIVGAVVVIAAGASAAWAVLVTAHPPIDLGLAARSLGETVSDLPVQLRQAIGVFGWNDTPMPQPVYLLTLAALGGLLVVALRVGEWRERLAVVWLAFATIAIHIGLGVLVEAQIGFDMQARYTLPLLVGVPLVSAWIVEGHEWEVDPRITRLLAPAIFAMTAVVQAVAFATNAHRYAVGGSASWTIPWDARWTPQGGYFLWFAVAAMAVALLAAPAVLALRPREPV